MKYVISRFNHNIGWLSDYTDDMVIYDRSDKPIKGSIRVQNIGSDIYDKLTFIIDNYNQLPEVAFYIKANLLDYIRPKEFELIKDNKTFTPILSQWHKEIMCDEGVCRQLGVQSKRFSYYQDGMYYELNYPSYLKNHPCKNQPTPITLDWYLGLQILKDLGIDQMEYIPFAPGSGYILTRVNILKHPKELYEKLRSYIDWAVYPGECMIIERGLYTLFH